MITHIMSYQRVETEHPATIERRKVLMEEIIAKLSAFITKDITSNDQSASFARTNQSFQAG